MLFPDMTIPLCLEALRHHDQCVVVKNVCSVASSKKSSELINLDRTVDVHHYTHSPSVLGGLCVADNCDVRHDCDSIK